jgi:hypothetical protein
VTERVEEGRVGKQKELRVDKIPNFCINVFKVNFPVLLK